MLRNTPRNYGHLSRALHWTMAVAILGMLALGTWIAWTRPTLSNLWLFGLHKSVGLSLLGLVVLRIAWHRFSPPPVPSGRSGTWQLHLARSVHRAIYLLLIAIPLSGWFASSASGIDTVFFGTLVVPPIAPPVAYLSDLGFAVHRVLTKVLAALLVVHVVGAFRHGLGPAGALRRMLAG